MCAAQAEFIPLVIVGGGFLFALICVAAMFNGLVRARNTCDESWSDIDTELRRRYDLIPNLVRTVKAYAQHEKDVLERVVQARQAAMAAHDSPKSLAHDENALIGALRNVIAVAESYPDLKASQNYLKLQEELAHTENRIQRARRFYNANVRDLANRIETFPSNIIASMFSFTKREFFEIEDGTVREAPAVRIH
jgi:LemA protein